jgi:predicted DsbA family dithiol-disulfide isomerase
MNPAPARSRLSIEVVSDMVCPWCLIGTRRLELALAAAGVADADLAFRPFLLDPSTPPEGEDLRGRLRRKYGDPEAMFARVEQAAKQSGIALDFGKVRRAVSTVGAHTLARHARAKGTQVAFVKALFGAYFLEGQDVSDRALLASLSTQHGFDEAEAARLLNDPAELEQTRREAAEAARAGVSGVPFTVVGGRYAVSGAQPVEVFRQAIERAQAEAGVPTG